jgi:medium-chain acyl-[acyl-carrier-protein] hydrolase
MPPAKSSLVFIRKEDRPNARLRLFCFTYAGASAQSFLTWNDHVPDFIEITGVELPGHGRRLFDGKPFNTYEPTAQYIADTLEPILDRPYALFGHCLGAVLAYEATRILKQRGAPEPVHLFTSGTRGPHYGIPIADVDNMDDEKFIEHFNNVYGASMDLLKDPQMRPLILPIVRADAHMTQIYHYQPGERVGYDVTAVAGERDPDVNLEQMRGWQQHTTGTVTTRLYPGDHFFFLQRARQMLGDFSRQLAAYTTKAHSEAVSL